MASKWYHAYYLKLVSQMTLTDKEAVPGSLGKLESL